MPVAVATCWNRREFQSLEPRGLAAPAITMPPLRGWSIGSSRVVRESHIVARAFRPCEAAMAGDFLGPRVAIALFRP
jgi:hypothetical protein